MKLSVSCSVTDLQFFAVPLLVNALMNKTWVSNTSELDLGMLLLASV